MRQLYFLEPGELEWRDAPEPSIDGPGQALVRPLAVARCDLDLAIVRGESPLRGPFPFGHECVGEIVGLSEDVQRFAVGQRVAVSFEIACGTCSRCLQGLTSHCASVPGPSMYGLGPAGGERWGNAIAELMRVPFALSMLAPLPEAADALQFASAGDNICDGWRTVAPHLSAQGAGPVLVVGGRAQSVGLYAVAAAKALGVEEVVYHDQGATRLATAEALGAAVIAEHYVAKGAFPITVDASASSEGLRCALLSVSPGGVCTSVGIYYHDVSVPLLQMYQKDVTLHTGRCNACHHLPEVVKAISDGRLEPEKVTSRIARWQDAATAMDDNGPKLIIARDELLQPEAPT